MTRLLWMLKNISHHLWPRALLFGIVAIVTALASIYLKAFISEELSYKIGAGAIEDILKILASSMLAVTIFSVSTMVGAYSSATNNVTPRATKLLLEDKLSHNALSTFIGSFIFSIVGIIALKAGAYGQSGQFILYIVTIILISIIIVTMFTWIDYLSKLGRVHETIRKVEMATKEALQERIEHPYLGGVPLEGDLNSLPGLLAVYASGIGYIQHIDMVNLNKIGERFKAKVYIHALPGAFITPDRPLAYFTQAASQTKDTQGDQSAEQAIKQCFIIDSDRSFNQDPRFGLSVLSEIAQRAMSPAVNDPGTAIQILGTGVRVLAEWATRQAPAADNHKILYPHVHVPGLNTDDLLRDFFMPMVNDVAGNFEVSMRLHKACLCLARISPEMMPACKDISAAALQINQQKILLDKQVKALEEITQSITLGA
jgi:uncharacterized membrane protein